MMDFLRRNAYQHKPGQTGMLIGVAFGAIGVVSLLYLFGYIQELPVDKDMLLLGTSLGCTITGLILLSNGMRSERR